MDPATADARPTLPEPARAARGAPAGRLPFAAMARRLRSIVGPSHVLDSPDTMAGYEVDWTGRWRGRAAAVVRPGSAEEVAAVLEACAAAGMPVVPQGGNTGLVGGGVPRRGEVVLSLGRLDDIGPVDADARQVSVGAGATLGELQRAVAGSGLTFGVDLAARDSATIGGMVATNAGGVHVLRYGPVRSQVVGLQVALAGGRQWERMTGLVKDNVGYDLTRLFVGSEGTLGVVTAARLLLVPVPEERVVLLMPADSLAGALGCCTRLRDLVPSLHAVEAWDARAMELVTAHTGLPHPFPLRPAWVVLAECAGPAGTVATASEGIEAALGTEDLLVSMDPGPCRRMWTYRERLTEAIATAGLAHKLDVTLPAATMAEFEHDLRALVPKVAPAATLVVFGHLGDGNLHVNVLGADPGDADLDDAILRLVAVHAGSISAEHGIGVAKARWLSLGRSPVDVGAMRSVKDALDPDALLNPGVIFEA